MNEPESTIRILNTYKSIEWRQNRWLHRLNGPAVEFVNGDKYWYIYGIALTENEYAIKIKNE